MKDSQIYYLVNSLICGISAVLYTLYKAFVAIAAFNVYFSTNVLTSENLVSKNLVLTKMLVQDVSLVLLLFIVVMVINHILVKKEKDKLLLTLTIICSFVLIFVIYQNIRIFV